MSREYSGGRSRLCCRERGFAWNGSSASIQTVGGTLPAVSAHKGRCATGVAAPSGSGGCPGWQLVLAERVSHVHRRIA